MGRILSLAIVGAIAVTTMGGCCAPDRNGSIAATEPVKWEEPFMLHEAKLPDGFPEAGPVGEVIVKTYPPCRLATVAGADLPGKGQDRMFMPLFNHIQKEKISMTSPVVMDFAATPADAAPLPPIAMSFVYGNEQIGQTGKDGIVRIHDLPAMTVLSVGVRGSYDGKNFDNGMSAINQWLASHPKTYTVVRTPRFLGYNSPFVPWFLRFGEVQVPVERVGMGDG